VNPIFLAGTHSAEFGAALAGQLGAPLGRSTVQQFPDGEQQALVEEDVEGAEVVLVQSLQPPVGEHLLELRLLADACLGAGARRLTAVVPYFAYARQDRRVRRGESLGGAVLARLVAEGFSRVLAVDLHAEAAEGWFTCPLEQVSALPALAEAVRPVVDPRAVVVSPDLGGAKRAERFARALGLELAIVHKSRQSGKEVTTHGLLGEVRDRPILIVDDLISTGGTIEAAVRVVRAARCAPDITVVASHVLLVGRAIERLAAAGIQRLVHSDSVRAPADLPFAQQVVSLAPALAAALRPLPPAR